MATEIRRFCRARTGDRIKGYRFGNRSILFGAAMLLSVLPMIILLSAFASQRVDDDFSRHLGLNDQGARIVGSLFRASTASVSTAVVLSLALSLAGTIALARSVQASAVWVAGLAGLLIADAAINKRGSGDGPLLDWVGRVRVVLLLVDDRL
jgi:hypothetical protein